MGEREKESESAMVWHKHMESQPLTCACHREGDHGSRFIPQETNATTIKPFESEEKCHNGFSQLRPNCRVHPPPEAFLSLIRGVSSCLQPKTCSRRHDGLLHEFTISSKLFHLSFPFLNSTREFSLHLKRNWMEKNDDCTNKGSILLQTNSD